MSKNIHDLSDDEFDDLFRDSAEKSGIDFDPEAWNKMSKKLDAATMPSSSPGVGGNPLRKWVLPIVIVLLLLITGTYFVLRKPSEAIGETKDKQKENILKQAEKVDKNNVATDKVDTENKNTAKEAPASNIKVPEEKVSPDKVSLDKSNSSEALSADNLKSGKSLSAVRKQNQADNKDALISKTPSVQKVKANNTGNAEVKSSETVNKETETGKVVSNDKAGIQSQLTDAKEIKRDNVNGISKNNKLRDKRTAYSETPSTKAVNPVSPKVVGRDLKTMAQSEGSIVDSVDGIKKTKWATVRTISHATHLPVINLKLPVINFESPFISPVIKPRENTAFRRGLNIRLALSPDFSFIPSNSFFKVGNNWAAIIEYRFNNRLSIQSGVIRSLKLYNALPSQYEWNSYWTMPSPLKDIDATCKMLDIPLNIRYDITQKANSRWFVGAGFTSYIMLKEEYIYNYENPSDPNIKRRNWEGKTGAYPFGVFNLSTGYERQIFHRLTFQAEPFFKAPLGKVGYGKVRLATAGVFFSVKYPF